MFKYSNTNKRYHTLDYYYKNKFGTKVSKISLNAGFTCPNKDGTKGVGGCIYCSSIGSGDYAASPSLVTPTNSIKITFTVSGMTNDNPDAVEETPTPAPKADKADSEDKDDESGISTPVVVGIVVAAVVVIAGVAVVVTRKKK